MQIWPLQEAKAKLTALINQAKYTPQIISRRGEPEIVAMSIKQYNQLMNPTNNLVSFLKKSALYGIDLQILRDKTNIRDLEL